VGDSEWAEKIRSRTAMKNLFEVVSCSNGLFERAGQEQELNSAHNSFLLLNIMDTHFVERELSSSTSVFRIRLAVIASYISGPKM